MSDMKGQRANQESSQIVQWHGLSTDDKPPSVEGAQWTSLDTGERWYYYKDMWIIDVSGPLLTQKDNYFR